MKFLSRSFATRNAASFMLAVWLFALAAGVANACLLEAPNHGGNQSSSESVHSTSPARAPAHGHEQSYKAQCLKACDEGSQALQTSKSMDSVDPGSLPLAAVLWTRRAALPARQQAGIDKPPSFRDPPERIIYSRWAL